MTVGKIFIPITSDKVNLVNNHLLGLTLKTDEMGY